MALRCRQKRAVGGDAAEAVNGAGVGDGEKGHGSAIGKVLGSSLGLMYLIINTTADTAPAKTPAYRGNSHTVELFH